MTRLFQGAHLQLNPGDSLGVIGVNSCGKTVLAKAIAGELPVFGQVTEDSLLMTKRFVPFHSSLSLTNGGAVYRQQRWNQIDTELLPKVSDELQKCENPIKANDLSGEFGLDSLLDSYVVNLSNGEQRKLELIQALSGKPDLLVLDNAFTGLDSVARQFLTQMLDALITSGQSIVMTGLELTDFPLSVKNFLVIQNGCVKQVFSRAEVNFYPKFLLPIEPHYPQWQHSDLGELIYLEDVTLKYGDRVILNHLNWQVLSGERWALSGPNGSGKTSLLNLIFGDNPKAYQFNIRLFGNQRGSGESIWDIKSRIGFISPELHQYLPQKQSVIDVICSGFKEAEGSFRAPSSFQRDVAKRWLRSLQYQSIGERKFGELSTSVQRVVLILRTLVKNPPLLILDEPFQGLDAAHVRLLKDLLNQIASESNCSMIFVTHIPSELPECFDKQLTFNGGNVQLCSSLV